MLATSTDLPVQTIITVMEAQGAAKLLGQPEMAASGSSSPPSTKPAAHHHQVAFAVSVILIVSAQLTQAVQTYRPWHQAVWLCPLRANSAISVCIFRHPLRLTALLPRGCQCALFAGCYIVLRLRGVIRGASGAPAVRLSPRREAHQAERREWLWLLPAGQCQPSTTGNTRLQANNLQSNPEREQSIS